ncbi:hypothetical protein E6H34_07290 [Candidatus Bathyarchaeota archaeon]|nr:MAG: hypothetical protein E6H34_07290 [Candidatus Bathyarchaeota archaeon]
MDSIIVNSGNRDGLPHSEAQEAKTDGRLKDILVDLIASSKTLDARVWLDGVYTDIGDEQVRGEWMNDRDVYFKVEGRIDKRNGSEQ